jgi:hypothetical protein
VDVVRPQNVDFSWARPPQAFNQSSSVDTRRQASEALITQILAAEGPRPQAVLSCCFSHDIELDLVDRVRAAGIPWINFFCDSLYAFDRVSSLAARTSLNWFVESEAEERYRALGVPYLRAPYALNPEALPDASCHAPDRSLLFIGSANHHRIRATALIRLAGADLKVRGWGWREALEAKSARSLAPSALMKRTGRAALRALLGSRIGGYLDQDTMLEELRRSAVILGLNAGGLGLDACNYLKLRDVEFPGMGCCYLCQHHKDLGDAFVLGQEVITFRTAWEAGQLARDLARFPAKCREIGRLARTRVLQDHTWSARLPMIESRL